MDWKIVVLGVLLLAIGFVMLVKGADWFVDGASGVAGKMKIPALVIGLTVVAFGTSAPELVTSITSAFQKSVGIAIGNVLGSNICNILLILGLSSIIAVLPVQKDSLKIDLPVLLGSAGLILLFGLTGKEGGEIARWEGAIMVVLLVAYTVLLIVLALRQRKKESAVSELTDHEVVILEEETPKKGFNAWYEKMKNYTWFLIVITLVGIGVVAGGASLAVNGAKKIAYEFGISENIVGLTVVAIGTSLPELITSVVASKKGETDIAVGNIVGSNIFNVLMVAGVSATIMPLPFAPNGNSFLIDGCIALGASVLLALFAYLPGHKIRRWNGIILFTGAVAYYVYTVVMAII